MPAQRHQDDQRAERRRAGRTRSTAADATSRAYHAHRWPRYAAIGERRGRHRPGEHQARSATYSSTTRIVLVADALRPRAAGSARASCRAPAAGPGRASTIETTRITAANAVQTQVSRHAASSAGGRWPHHACAAVRVVRRGRRRRPAGRWPLAACMGGRLLLGGRRGCVVAGGGRWAAPAAGRREPTAASGTGLSENHIRAGPSQSVTTAAPMPPAQKVAAADSTNQSLAIPATNSATARTVSASRALRLRWVICQPRITIAVAHPAATIAAIRTTVASWVDVRRPRHPGESPRGTSASVVRVSSECSPAMRSHIWQHDEDRADDHDRAGDGHVRRPDGVRRGLAHALHCTTRRAGHRRAPGCRQDGGMTYEAARTATTTPTTATPAAAGSSCRRCRLGLWQNFGDDRPEETQRAILRRAFDRGRHPLRPGQQLRPAVRPRRGELRALDARGLRAVPRRAGHLHQGRATTCGPGRTARAAARGSTCSPRSTSPWRGWGWSTSTSSTATASTRTPRSRRRWCARHRGAVGPGALRRHLVVLRGEDRRRRPRSPASSGRRC